MVAALRQLQVAFLAVVWNAFGNAAHSSLHHAEIDHAGVEGLTLRPSKLNGSAFSSTEATCDVPAMMRQQLRDAGVPFFRDLSEYEPTFPIAQQFLKRKRDGAVAVVKGAAGYAAKKSGLSTLRKTAQATREAEKWLETKRKLM